MLSILPTYDNYTQLPSLVQGSGVPYIFQVTDLKTPEFIHTILDGEALTVTSGTLIELDLSELKTFKKHVVLSETNISLLDIGEEIGSNYLQVYGIKVADRLTAEKIYTMKVIMSDASEFYTDIFQYCTENQV